MTENKNKEGAGVMLIFIMLLVAAALWISFKLAKIVYRYSRDILLSIWSFLITLIVLITTFFEFNEDFPSGFGIIVIFWCLSFLPILIATLKLYKINKIKIDQIIAEEDEVEKYASQSSGVAKKLLFSAGAAYVGYQIGKNTSS